MAFVVEDIIIIIIITSIQFYISNCAKVSYNLLLLTPPLPLPPPLLLLLLLLLPLALQPAVGFGLENNILHLFLSITNTLHRLIPST